MKSLLAGAAIALVSIAPTIAHAQNPVSTAAGLVGLKVKKPIRLQLGGYFPTDSSLKNGVSKEFTRYGASYDVFKSPVLVPFILSGYVDGILSKEKKFGSPEKKNAFSMVGVGVQVRQYFNAPLLPISFYTGLAAGPYFVHAKFADESFSKTVFGGKVFAGVELAQTFYGVVDYTYLSKVSVGKGDYKPSGFGASLGVRF